MFLIPFATAYARKILPKGCSLPRLEYPLVRDYAPVTEIHPNEAAVAFRIDYPVNPSCSASWRSRSSLELLFYDNAIWWPFGGSLYSLSPDRYEGERASCLMPANEWREGLGSNRDLLKLVPNGAQIVQTETASRIPYPDEAGETVARIQRSFSRGYLICGGFVYVRGGAPVYAQWKDRNRRTVMVTSSGCGRNVVGKQDCYSPPAYFNSYKTQQAFYEGRFWLPDAEEEVRRRLTKSQTGYPRIEVCLPDLLHDNLEKEIQLDALFRETARLSEIFISYILMARDKKSGGMPRSAPGSKEFANMIAQTFRDAAEPRMDPQGTTALRMAALRSLLDSELRLPRHRVRGCAVLPCFRAYRDFERRHPREVLADEDEKALGDVAFLP